MREEREQGEKRGEEEGEKERRVAWCEWAE